MTPRDAILPVVLVGGRSSRFGRDKLREPLGHDEWLVDRPIAALRAAFGPRVVLVGACNAEIRLRGDDWLDEEGPAARGPAAGIAAALRRGSDVFVLAGDLPSVTEAVVELVLDVAAQHPDALAALARTDRVEPCVGLYRRAALPFLDACLEDPRGALMRAIPEARLALVDVDPTHLRNVNRPEDLAAAEGAA
ncbi:MAG: molybdenum cofactor guanylyltransferase [Phycisphaerae bacterium]|nr:molybdenum cofactor guanylyltransferase [Phycisphaerae bacterium]